MVTSKVTIAFMSGCFLSLAGFYMLLNKKFK
jgi:hypothetical protein